MIISRIILVLLGIITLVGEVAAIVEIKRLWKKRSMFDNIENIVLDVLIFFGAALLWVYAFIHC